MSFSVQLTPDVLPVEPGSTTPMSLVVVNRSDSADRFEMEVEGIDSEWKAVPVPVFGVDPNETHTEKIFFKPRRDSESLAGNYPFVVRVRSLETGEQRTVQGVLQVRPFHHLTMEISPKKGFVSPARKQNFFDVSILNLGNTEHTLQLAGSDPEDACTYEFEQEQVTVAPGQQKEVELTVNPTSQPIFSGGRLIGFTLTGRSIDAPSVVASAQAQLEQRSLFSPASLIALLIVAVALGGWLLMMPKPPSLALSVDPLQAERGQSVNVTWTAERASRVTIQIGETIIYDGPDLRGTRAATLSQSGTVTILGIASKDGNKKQETVAINVTEPAPVPPPAILVFSVDKERVKLGESFILHYDFNDSVSRAVLQPLGDELDLALNELEVTPRNVGESNYTVVAMNKKGETTQKTIKVRVYEESDAKIPVFRADPTVIKEPDTRVTLTWLVTGAVNVELSYEGKTPQAVPSTGPMSFDITAKTTFVLTAYDDKGRATTRKVTVDYKKQELPPPEPDSTTATTSGTATSGTSDTSTTGAVTTGGR